MKVERRRLAALVVIFVLAGGLLAYGYGIVMSPGKKQEHETTARKFLPKLAKVRTHLYFLDKNCLFLRAEERGLTQQDNVIERARSIVRALIDGPESELLPTLPAETKLLSLFVSEDGVAYVDFDRAVKNKHPGGALSELFTVFSVVNTLALSMPEVEAVKIMIEGREAKTMAGHIDIRLPFRPDILMIK